MSENKFRCTHHNVEEPQFTRKPRCFGCKYLEQVKPVFVVEAPEHWRSK